MVRKKVYLIDLSIYGFRKGEPCEIIGVEMITPDNLQPRLCYHLRFPDMVEDFKPIHDGNYKFYTLNELYKQKQ